MRDTLRERKNERRVEKRGFSRLMNLLDNTEGTVLYKAQGEIDQVRAGY